MLLHNMVGRPRLSRTLLFMLIASSVTIGFARMARSGSYDLEYSSIGAGCGNSQSTNQDYDITGFVTTDGLVDNITGSSDYTITPLVGGSSDNNASIACWTLY